MRSSFSLSAVTFQGEHEDTPGPSKDDELRKEQQAHGLTESQKQRGGGTGSQKKKHPTGTGSGKSSGKSSHKKRVHDMA